MIIIPGNVYSYKSIPAAAKLYSKLELFPTPFKGIYYAPYETEKKGQYITDPYKVLFDAVALYLKSEDYYFGLSSALYYLREIWNAQGTDIINKKLSRIVKKAIPAQTYWRGKVVAKILSQYPFPIRFHRVKSFSFEGTKKKGSIVFSGLEKTLKDARYLCNKGDKTACGIIASKAVKKMGLAAIVSDIRKDRDSR